MADLAWVSATAAVGSAVALNAAMTGGNGTGGKCQQAAAASSISAGGLTIGAGSNRYLVVAVVWSSNVTARTIQCLVGATPTTMTELIYFIGLSKITAFYGIANPDVGVQTITGAWTNPEDCYLSAACFNNVASVNTADNQAAASATVVVPSGANDATVTAISTDNGDPASSKTLIFANSPFAPGGGADYALGGVTNTHTWTNAGTESNGIGIHLVAA